jgi:hypothetical protein
MMRSPSSEGGVFLINESALSAPGEAAPLPPWRRESHGGIPQGGVAVKLYWKHRVWSDMYELFANLDSVIGVWPDEQEQLLEAHRLTVGEFERFKEMLGDDLIVEYVQRPRNVNVIRVALPNTHH